MRCFKLLGECVMARDFDRQVAELQVRAAILNRFTRLGTSHHGRLAVNPSGVWGITRSADLCKKAVPVPSVEEQGEIVVRIDTLFAFADRLEARLVVARTATDRLTPALLAKAFRGELVPQDPNDEPAYELLKRLAADVSKPRMGRTTG
jgi:hypothetical protein